MSDTTIIVATIAFLGTIITAAITLLGVIDRSISTRAAQQTSKIESTLSSIGVLANAEASVHSKSVIVGTAYGLIKLDQADLALALVEGKLSSTELSFRDAVPIISIALSSEDADTRVIAARILRDQAKKAPLTDTGEIHWPKAVSAMGWQERFQEPELRYVLEAAQLAFLSSDFELISENQLNETLLIHYIIAKKKGANKITKSMAILGLKVLLPYMTADRLVVHGEEDIKKSDIEKFIIESAKTNIRPPKSELHRISLLRAQVGRYGATAIEAYIEILAEEPQKAKLSTANGYAYFEGDILIGETEETLEKSRHIVNALEAKDEDEDEDISFGVVITGPISIWPMATIPYRIELPKTETELVLSAMQLWQNNTNVKFVTRTEDNQPQYNNFVAFKLAIKNGSYLGMRGGRQSVYLQKGVDLKTVTHLLGHTLGLKHEHNREDRDEHIAILWNNTKRRNVPDFEKNGTEILGTYDLASIMHASPDTHSKNGQPTIISLSSVPISTDVGLISHEDSRKVALTYDRTAE